MKLGIDFGGVEETSEKKSFEPLPVGIYTVTVIDTEVKATKAGTGTYMKVTFEAVDEKFAGRKLFANYNLTNPNPVAEEIGRTELKALIKASGLDPQKFEDSDELHGASVIATVIVKNDATYGAKNEIKRVEKLPLSKEAKHTMALGKKIFGKDTKATFTAKQSFTSPQGEADPF